MIFLIEPQINFFNMGPSGPCSEYGGGKPCECEGGWAW